MGLSRAAYYDRRSRHDDREARGREVRRVEHAVVTTFEEHRGRYGRPRLQRELARKGVLMGANKLRLTMAKLGLFAKPKRRFRKTTEARAGQRVAPNLLKQNFESNAPNRIWVSDITYIRTWKGWLYACFIIDLFSRKVVGWALRDHMRAELVTEAFDMAVARRDVQPGLIFHSDRGSQFASKAMRSRLNRIAAVQSMSGKGNCFDNAVAESFHDKLKQELIHRHSWPNLEAARKATIEYVERYFNAVRMHSKLGYVSPNQFEEIQQAVPVAA